MLQQESQSTLSSRDAARGQEALMAPLLRGILWMCFATTVVGATVSWFVLDAPGSALRYVVAAVPLGVLSALAWGRVPSAFLARSLVVTGAAVCIGIAWFGEGVHAPALQAGVVVVLLAGVAWSARVAGWVAGLWAVCLVGMWVVETRGGFTPVALSGERVLVASLTSLAVATWLLQAHLQTLRIARRREREESARALREAQRREDAESRLRQAHRLEAMGQLAGGIAHDFNNLLTVIGGNLALLDTLPGEQGESVRDAYEAVQRGVGLTERLLAFSRQHPRRPERVHVNDLLRATVRLLQRTLGEHLHVDLDLDPRVPSILVDPGLLENALLNLALNARDAMPEGGRLRLASKAARLPYDRPGVALIVEDTGAGMPAHVLSRATEPFYTTKGQGTGLGLAMVQGFAQQCGGLLDLSSDPGRGTTVTLRLPAATPSVHRGAASEDHPALRSDARCVLVVEDDAPVRRLAVRTLTQLGYRTREASDAEQALACLEEATPDVLFTDVGLRGGMSGVELVAAVRARWPDLPVLFTSGHSAGRLRGLTRRDLLLEKPYGPRKLAVKLAQAIATPSASPAAQRAP